MRLVTIDFSKLILNQNQMIDGKREGAGRKSRWRSPTKMIRLPAQYESQIVEYAKQLDSESYSGRSVLLHDVVLAIADVLVRLPPAQRAGANRLFKRLIKRLKVEE